jgi:hypothetical protein
MHVIYSYTDVRQYDRREWRLQLPPADRQSTTTAAPGSSDGPLWGARGASHYGKCHMWPFPWSLIPGQAAQGTSTWASHITGC